MSPLIVDVNVWLAILLADHPHHPVAHAWFTSLAASRAGLCRIVHLSLLRLLGSRSMMGELAMPAFAAWNLLRGLIENDERVVFLPEPAGIDEVLPALLRYPVPTAKLVPDAYLAAFASVLSAGVVTFDAGFRQFDGLPVTLLKPVRPD